MFFAVRGLERSRRRALSVAALVCVILAIFQPVCSAQKSEKPATRKLVYRVSPEYPWDLKRAHIGGIVRMDVIVTPHGSVDTISVIGGNPILAETATRAVKKWKYAPAEAESVLRVTVEFDPNR